MTLEDIKQWLGVDFPPELYPMVINLINNEKKERLLRNINSDIDYGYSFPGLSGMSQVFLSELRAFSNCSGRPPKVADIGAGFGNTTTKALLAGAHVDAFEIQKPSADELSKRIKALDPRFWQGRKLDKILKVYVGNALELLKDKQFENHYDFIWMSQVIHFLTPDEIRVLNQLFQSVLRPGGRVFLLSNNIHIFDHADSAGLIKKAYEQGISKDLFCPGFMAMNLASLRDATTMRLAGYEVLSTYNQEQMTINSIPFRINAYGKGFIGPTPDTVSLGALDNVIKRHPEQTYVIDRFHQVVNLFDPDTATITFQQSGFEVVSFRWEPNTNKIPFENSDHSNTATVIILEKKNSSAIASSTSSTTSTSIRSLSQISRHFDQCAEDKLSHAIKQVTDPKSNKTLNDAFIKKDFSLLLRKACCGPCPAVIKILVQHKEELNININAPSSNKMTALDWLQEAQTELEIKTALKTLLISHGAKSGITAKECEFKSSTASS